MLDAFTSPLPTPTTRPSVDFGTLSDLIVARATALLFRNDGVAELLDQTKDLIKVCGTASNEIAAGVSAISPTFRTLV